MIIVSLTIIIISLICSSKLFLRFSSRWFSLSFTVSSLELISFFKSVKRLLTSFLNFWKSYLRPPSLAWWVSLCVIVSLCVKLNLWWVSNKTIIEVGNNKKDATFKTFFHLNYKNTQLLFLCFFFLNYCHESNIKQWSFGVTQKYELRVSFKDK